MPMTQMAWKMIKPRSATEGRSMNLQFIGKFVPVVALAIALLACVQPEQQYVNNPAFAQRTPPAGLPTYGETIKYIDDGLRYVDPTAAFFVSSDGQMCFRGASPTLLGNFYNSYHLFESDWCLPPVAVKWVHSIEIGNVSLSCKHADPQCIREIGNLYRATNTIHIRIVPSDRERSAVEHLIYLMGGNLGDSHHPFKSADRLRPLDAR
jgi:hypothetical protein